MHTEAKTNPRRALPAWAPRLQAAPSLWHRWGRTDCASDPVRADADETPAGKARVKAHLMIQADPLSVHQVLEEVRSLEAVTEAREGKGPFDIVAIIDADSTPDLPSLLCRATFTIPGVCAAAVVVSEPAPWYEEVRTRIG